jgi:glycerol-3-phosphate dehydrogenase
MQLSQCDILIIGGGINGCGIARELAGRGHQIILCEKNDIASATSSWSTKLIHGGLRYLEHYKFRLVREALKERDILINMAPHLIHPMRFVLPHQAGMRPKWLLQMGLFIYANLGGRSELARPTSVDLTTDAAGHALRSDITHGFEYTDCFVDDSRLTLANARAASQRGAKIYRDSEIVQISKSPKGWVAKTSTREIHAEMIINAGGPFVDQIMALQQDRQPKKNIRLVRGSHLITKRIFNHNKAYVFQNSDGRILFALPYLDDFTLLGTTDMDHQGSADHPQISNDEIDYICNELGHYLATPLNRETIIASYSGVRPLFDDGKKALQSITRDYVLSWQDEAAKNWLNVFGGKLTTYRQLAVKVARLVNQKWPAPKVGLASSAHLPGGDIPCANFQHFLDRVKRDFPAFPEQMITRMARAYGSEIYAILGTADRPKRLGQAFGYGLYQAEIEWLIEQEWVRTAEDILDRRTKLGLYFDASMKTHLANYLNLAED